MAIMISKKCVCVTRIVFSKLLLKGFNKGAYKTNYAKSAKNAKNEQEFDFDLEAALVLPYLRFVNAKDIAEVVEVNLECQ